MTVFRVNTELSNELKKIHSLPNPSINIINSSEFIQKNAFQGVL